MLNALDPQLLLEVLHPVCSNALNKLYSTSHMWLLQENNYCSLIVFSLLLILSWRRFTAWGLWVSSYTPIGISRGVQREPISARLDVLRPRAAGMLEGGGGWQAAVSYLQYSLDEKISLFHQGHIWVKTGPNAVINKLMRIIIISTMKI